MLFLFAACQPATMELTEERKAEIAAEFRQFRMDLYASNERLDIEQTLNSIAEDVALIVQGTRLRYDDFATAARGGFGSLQSLSVDVQDMQIDVLGEDVVVNTDVVVDVVTDTTGTTVEQTHLHTEVWVKRDGRWVMTHGHKSNPPE
jgi:hypothetical protein